MNNSYNIGKLAEERVVSWYIERGFEIVATNYIYHRSGVRGRQGEIDIIAIKNDVLHVVEVKSRADMNNGHPLESITKSKLKLIYNTLQKFLLQSPIYRNKSIQFDCAWIVESYEVQVIHNAATFDFLV